MRQAKAIGWYFRTWQAFGIGRITRCYDRWRQRRRLEELESCLLADIGISHHQAKQEADKPFWIN